MTDESWIVTSAPGERSFLDRWLAQGREMEAREGEGEPANLAYAEWRADALPQGPMLFGEFEAATPGFCDACNDYIGVGRRVFYDGAYRVCIPCAGLNKNDTTETGGPEL